MGVARALLLGWLLLAGVAFASGADSFFGTRAGAEIDWTAGTLTVSAGAAADPRMPSPSAARPGAERRARAAALGKLRVAARELVGKSKVDVEAALGRAAAARTEYQSNGGVVLWMTLRFAELVPAKPAARALRVESAPLHFAPTVAAGGKAAVVGYATYRPAAGAPGDALRARRDGAGRLVLAGAQAGLVDSLAGTAVVIYLEKPQP